MNYRYDSQCGLYCGGCGVIHAVEKGNLDEFAKKWDSTAKRMECHGCKSDQVAEFCNQCGIRKCAIDKGHDFCHECDDFACEMMMDFITNQSAHPKIHLNNLNRIKEAGVDTWLAEQNARWSCPDCNTKFHFDEKTCIQCGKTLHNLVDEANDLKKEDV